MPPSEPIQLSRECPAIEVPSGARRTLAKGTTVRIMQSLGGSYTVSTDRSQMYRVDAADADALGQTSPAASGPAAPASEFSEALVWKQLKTVYDPEIPVNLVDLGLIYACEVSPLDPGQHRINVRMTMTAPGCGMADVLKADVENRLGRLPGVKEVRVEVVFDPPWNPGRMSEAAKLQLGMDLDYNPPQSDFPVFPTKR